MKKILMVSEYYLPHWTGLSKSFHSMARELARNNEVEVLTTLHDPKCPRQERIDGIPVTRVPYLAKISRTHYSGRILIDFLSRVRRADIVFVNCPNSNILPLAAIAKLHGKRLAIFHQGDLRLPRQGGSRVLSFLLERTFDACTLPSLWLADRVFTYTTDYARHSRVLRYFLPKLGSFVPPVSVSPSPRESRVAARLETLHERHPLIGFAGRFVEEKGFDLLLEAIPQVVAEIPEARFVFAGETKMGYERFFERHARLVDQHAEHLVFLGRLGEEELGAFYRHLDLFVVSSRSDCFNLAQLEAALCGVPVVTTNIPGARVLVSETGFGEVVRAESPASLAQGILTVIRNKERYGREFSRVERFVRRNGTISLE